LNSAVDAAAAKPTDFCRDGTNAICDHVVMPLAYWVNV
jgi:hypothetical protein